MHTKDKIKHPEYEVCKKCGHDVFKHVIDQETRHKNIVCVKCGEIKSE